MTSLGPNSVHPGAFTGFRMPWRRQVTEVMDAQRWHPSRRGTWWLTGGVGVGRFEVDGSHPITSRSQAAEICKMYVDDVSLRSKSFFRFQFIQDEHLQSMAAAPGPQLGPARFSPVHSPRKDPNTL